MSDPTTTTTRPGPDGGSDDGAGRLLLEGRLDALREEVTTVRRVQFKRLLGECERYRSMELPTEHPSASITYFGPAAANLALAYRLTGQQHFLTELERWLESPLGFPHWGKANMPDHDLDAGWILHGLSLALSWAGDALPEETRERLEAKLLLQGRRLYDFAVESEGGWWSSSYWQNHNWICYAGLATAGYVLAPRHPEAKAWTERAKENFTEVLGLLPEDGSNNEGVVYWRYGVPWIVSYLDVLEAAEGIDLFEGSDYLRHTFYYRLYQAAPDLERIINHGDCHDRRSGHSVSMYYKLASKYRLGHAQWLADRVSERFYWREAYESGVKPGVRPEAYQELLWYDPSVEPEPVDTLPTSRFFADLGLVVGRTSWDDDAVMVSFKASPGGGHKAWESSHRLDRERGWRTLNAGHHQPDAGTFTLLGHDAYLAIDEGYSNRKRHGHQNGILVDGQGFANEDRYHVYEDLAEHHVARITETVLEAGWTCASSETGAMYADELGVRRVDRHLALSPRGTLLVVDHLESETPRTWSWLLHADHPFDVADGTALTEAAPGRLRVSGPAPGDATWSTRPTEVFANPTASTPSLAVQSVQHTLVRETGPTTRAVLVSVLEPLAWHDDTPSSAHVREQDGTVVVGISRGGVVEELAVALEDGADAKAALAGECAAAGTRIAVGTSSLGG
ncbi:hypothetical protein NOK12_01120 [Nocardioides sp. OK12]|uniref:Heparinase II N-terminal domain-containing protein n=1 Tax=Nocardioides marinisabuli TaxID=419476 RepID=A0A7Y9F1R9_9ACTN|nr:MULTISPECIES: DUF4962 domain-containing protein [Nocardioides]NYD57918.1 hypothetical protein [Nocardioides marinisabuli]GHJ57593.1 hypothetical protein NOK12_01120 [Nocardioides sp. OK12]